MKERSAKELIASVEASLTPKLDSLSPTTIRRIAEALRMAYNQKKVSNLILAHAIEKLVRLDIREISGAAEFEEVVKEITIKAPQWLKIVNNPEAIILRSDLSVTKNEQWSAIISSLTNNR